MTFGQKIKEMRLKKNWGLRHFATMTSMRPSSLANIQASRRKPTTKELTIILDSLNVTGELREKLMVLSEQELPQQNIINQVPVFVTTTNGKQLTTKKLDRLLETIKKTNSY